MAEFDRELVDAVIGGIIDPATRPDEIKNIVTALDGVRDQALSVIKESADKASEAHDWKIKTRLAVVAMYLGDTSIASEMLRTEPREGADVFDPVQRTSFIEEFGEWSGDMQLLAKPLQTTEDAHLRSGMSLALGGIENIDAQAEEAWREVLADWHLKPDSGTHSAIEWAARQWEIELPEGTETLAPPTDRNWWHTPMELRMVKIPSGMVVTDEKPISIESPFWLSDREISITLFEHFMDDAQAAQRPDKWEGASGFEGSIDVSHPVQQVSWEDAVMFCNWLSARHGLDKCYTIDPLASPRKPSSGTVVYQIYDVTLHETHGFRLPTADEWEYACRAMTTTQFSSGDDEKQLRAYATFLTSRTSVCGFKLCNAWGLFDMHGNVWEWCWDSPGDSDRAYCGGSWGYDANVCRSSYRIGNFPANRNRHCGFRVAQGLSGKASSGAESGSLETGKSGAPVDEADATATAAGLF